MKILILFASLFLISCTDDPKPTNAFDKSTTDLSKSMSSLSNTITEVLNEQPERCSTTKR